MVKSRDSFFPGRVKGAGPGVWGILVLRARRFLVTWSLHGAWDGKLFLCLITIYCNLTLFFFIALFKLLFCYWWFSPPSKRASLFKYIIIFCFILLFTFSSPCRKDQFPVLYFLQVIIVLIQVYNWEIRHHSTG